MSLNLYVLLEKDEAVFMRNLKSSSFESLIFRGILLKPQFLAARFATAILTSRDFTRYWNGKIVKDGKYETLHVFVGEKQTNKIKISD